jgi:hypothetical protein
LHEAHTGIERRACDRDRIVRAFIHDRVDAAQ